MSKSASPWMLLVLVFVIIGTTANTHAPVGMAGTVTNQLGAVIPNVIANITDRTVLPTFTIGKKRSPCSEL